MRLYYNLELFKHINQIQVILNYYCFSKDNSLYVFYNLKQYNVTLIPYCKGESLTLIDLLSRTGPNKFKSLRFIKI